MDDFLSSINLSLQNNNYYAALFMTIMLPSVCNALASPTGNDTRLGFISWFNAYVTGLSMNGNDCYNLRCALLHQGASIPHGTSSFSRIVFTFPTPSGNTFHNNILNDALNLDIPLFCQTVIAGVRKWVTDMANNPDYTKNLSRLLKTYPTGLAPYIVGHPVIS